MWTIGSGINCQDWDSVCQLYCPFIDHYSSSSNKTRWPLLVTTLLLFPLAPCPLTGHHTPLHWGWLVTCWCESPGPGEWWLVVTSVTHPVTSGKCGLSAQSGQCGNQGRKGGIPIMTPIWANDYNLNTFTRNTSFSHFTSSFFPFSKQSEWYELSLCDSCEWYCCEVHPILLLSSRRIRSTLLIWCCCCEVHGAEAPSASCLWQPQTQTKTIWAKTENFTEFSQRTFNKYFVNQSEANWYSENEMLASGSCIFGTRCFILIFTHGQFRICHQSISFCFLLSDLRMSALPRPRTPGPWNREMWKFWEMFPSLTPASLPGPL